MQENKLNFVFFGTPDVASETLEILKQSGFLPTLIVTSPDAQKGRGLQMQASPAALFAEQNNIPCLKPQKITDEFVNSLPSTDLNIVIAYGKILPENLIKLPRLGSINIHYSLLPKYRGASPLESALLNDDATTGIAIQQMEYKMDSGPILSQVEVPINATDTIIEMREKLITLGANTLVEILPKIFNQEIKPTPQDPTAATFCKKIKKEDGLVNFELDSAETIYNKYRAYKIWPRTYFFKDGKRIIITDAILEDNKFIIKKVIPEGGKEQEYKN